MKEVMGKVLRRHPCPLQRQTLVVAIDNHPKALFGPWMMSSGFDNVRPDEPRRARHQQCFYRSRTTHKVPFQSLKGNKEFSMMSSA